MDKEMDQDKLQQENQKFVEEYEFIQKKLEDGEGTSYRRMQDLSELVQKQQEKLAKDAEAQKKYGQKRQDYLCEKLRKQLVELKLRLLEVAEPSDYALDDLKRYAAVADEAQDTLLRSALANAFDKVQRTADVALLPGRWKICAEDYPRVLNVYMGGRVVSVTDGNGNAVSYPLCTGGCGTLCIPAR